MTSATAHGAAGLLYRTGDLCVRLPCGRLECLGRIDSTVKIRGYKVAVPFVESTIKEHESVASAAVMPVANAAGNATDQPRYVYFTSYFDTSATEFWDALRENKYRDNFTDELRDQLPEELRILLEW